MLLTVYSNSWYNKVKEKGNEKSNRESKEIYFIHVKK